MRQTRASLLSAALLTTLLAGCGNPQAPAPSAHAALSPAADTSTATVGDATLQASAVAITNLNEAMAARYGLDGQTDGALLLVTVRDATGNALPVGDLRVTATATVLPDPPKGLQLQPIQVDGLTDYIGVFAARPPATVEFRVTAVRNGARTEMTTTAELYPR